MQIGQSSRPPTGGCGMIFRHELQQVAVGASRDLSAVRPSSLASLELNDPSHHHPPPPNRATSVPGHDTNTCCSSSARVIRWRVIDNFGRAGANLSWRPPVARSLLVRPWERIVRARGDLLIAFGSFCMRRRPPPPVNRLLFINHRAAKLGADRPVGAPTDLANRWLVSARLGESRSRSVNRASDDLLRHARAHCCPPAGRGAHLAARASRRRLLPLPVPGRRVISGGSTICRSRARPVACGWCQLAGRCSFAFMPAARLLTKPARALGSSSRLPFRVHDHCSARICEQEVDGVFKLIVHCLCKQGGRRIVRSAGSGPSGRVGQAEPAAKTLFARQIPKQRIACAMPF